MKGPKRSSPCPTTGRPLTDQGTTASASNHDPIFSPERAPRKGTKDYRVKAFDNATTYTTTMNVIATLSPVALIA